MSKGLVSVEECWQDILSGVSLLDLRAEIEFERSHFKQAVNHPLLTTEERRLVGLEYKTSGQKAAIELGHKLVCGEVKERRVLAWVNFAKAGGAYIFCARGGLRSEISQNWLREAGVFLPRIEGGYKALRQKILRSMAPPETTSFVILAGMTGAGKTDFLNSLETPNAILDLEGLAVHRGSSFGKRTMNQPTQAVFENELVLSFLRALTKSSIFILEDESQRIGELKLPDSWFEKMQRAPRIILERPFEERIQRILDEYVRRETEARGIESQREFLLGSIQRIRKKLGGERTERVLALAKKALKSQEATGSLEDHREWIAELLKYYYDPLYLKSLRRNEKNIIFKGGPREVSDFLRAPIHIKLSNAVSNL